MIDVRVTFVLPDNKDESQASEVMEQAFDSCKELVDNITWARESELSTKKLSKLDYLVFESFEGKNFDKLLENKCAILGPMAISVCVMEGKPIPSFQWPIFNVAMYGCHVTCSQISKSGKEEIKNKVQLMGGLYTGTFTSSVTHLICDGTKSEKYMLAAEKGVKLMLPSWIDHLFEASQSSNVNANDEQILRKYKCPIFHNLTICTTGINSSKEKAKLSEVVNANGGKLVARLNLAETDVLICHGVAGTTSEKFKAARKKGLSCLTLEWIFDSIEKGYALPYEQYFVKAVTSTPTKEGENIDPNFSTISCIGMTSTIQKSTINETANTTQMSTMATVAGTTRASMKRKASEDLVEKIDIKKVKSAGQFLDGCSVYVIGFSSEHREKLNKIVNLSGATRYDDFSERVTHVIVGNASCPEVVTMQTMGFPGTLVSVQWLLDSVEQQRPAKEEKYLITKKSLDEDAERGKIGSPLSKKALSLLKSSNLNVSVAEEKTTVPEPANDPDDALTQKYLRNASAEKEEVDTLAALLDNQSGTLAGSKTNQEQEEFQLRTRSLQNKYKNARESNNQTLEFKPHETSTQVSQVTSDMSENTDYMAPIFQSKNFFLYGFDEQEMDTFVEIISGVGGTVVDKRFKGVADYAVVPVTKQPPSSPAVRETVNNLWLLQCFDEESVLEIQYYHRPITLPSTGPLENCVVTISGYSGQERQFLRFVIEGLSGIFQEQFSRKDIPAKNVLASTHLVSPEASGKKYEAALKWNLPVVSKDWLMECARTGTKVNVEEFLINDSTPSNSEVDQKKSNKLSELDRSHNSNQSANDHKTSPIENLNKNNSSSKEIGTPASVKSVQNDAVCTPVNQIYNFNQKDTPEACSQVTPINKIVQDAINDKVLPTPPSPQTYYPWNPKTPDTPIGAFIRPNPSPRLRKEMQKYINAFPDFVPPTRRLSTPLSELKRRLRDKVMGRGMFAPENSQDETGPSTAECEDVFNDNPEKESQVPVEENVAAREEQPVDSIVHQKLQELQQRVMAAGSSSTTRRSSRMFEATHNPPAVVAVNTEVQSQVCTVGWDYGLAESQTTPQKVFLLSGIEPALREQLTDELKSLGGIVSETNMYDSNCTHLICPKPARNEKTLACMAAGKWILHLSYVEKCVAAGKFLDEEEFEFGNPKSIQNVPCGERDGSIYFWRREVKRRGYGAFNDMRAIVVAEKREPIANVIEAGGGVVLQVTPPYEDSIHATHCLLEVKMIKDFQKYVPLAQQGIKCVNTIYINDFLWRQKKRRD